MTEYGYPLQLPEPPRGPRDPRPRVAVVALLSGLLGALLGSGISVWILRPDTASPQPPAAVVQEVLAPTVIAPGEGQPDRITAIAAAVLPSVVQVDISATGGANALSGNGSGVIYRSDGFIVTNNHVVAAATRILVRFDGGGSMPARVVGTDPLNDLAVIKVDAVDLPAIQIGDPSRVRIGDLAIAIGSPFGLSGSVTAGIVSGLGRPLDFTTPEGDPVQLVNAIQTDAPINPGNSGGALVGADGRLIGINSAIFTNGELTNAGVGFAIASDTVVRVVDQLIAEGVVRYSFLGIQGQSVSPDDAARLGVQGGTLITRVEPGGPADRAGLLRDDVIIEADGEPIQTMDGLVALLRERPVGQRIRLTYIRQSSRQTVDVVLAERPAT
ncbi:MAG: S1C family serine protease [Egibacteraceae bacterium]